jgi:hypothetical protein
MSAKLIADALSAKPFVPFEITTDNGRAIPVPGPGRISFTGDKKSVIVCEGASCHLLSVSQVNSVRPLAH